MATADVCRRHWISSATSYKWKAKYGGLEVSEARRLRALKEENARLKKLLAQAGIIPSSIAASARERISIDNGLPIHASLHPASTVNQISARL